NQVAYKRPPLGQQLLGDRGKIFCPFRLKPWHKSKIRCNENKKNSKKKKNFCFLTVWGMEGALFNSGSVLIAVCTFRSACR
ncbi:hypothetical protein KC220_26855, partial [Mycobacterium tuberculosis]|nr:hypothetical protein [Mycobacterium tuberculosis]